MDQRTVPVFVPVWEDANRVRPWDGSAKAQAWASLMDFRDQALAESAARVIAAGGADDTDVLGLVSFLWGIDESEVAKILRRRMGSVSERVAELGA
jgi:hypothetical protein